MLLNQARTQQPVQIQKKQEQMLANIFAKGSELQKETKG